MTKTATSTTTSRHKVKPFTAQVFVKDIIYRVNPKGKLYPILSLRSNKVLLKHNIDAIMFEDIIKPMQAHLLEKKIRLKVKFNEYLVPQDVSKLSIAGEHISPPSSCPSCNNSLAINPDGWHCTNIFCPGTSRGCIYKMFDFVAAIECVNNPTFIVNAKRFLDGFMLGDDKISIENLYEVKIALLHNVKKDTQPRLNNWVKQYGEVEGEELWKLERILFDYFKTDITTYEFWTICNFPKITQEEFVELQQLNPFEFLEGSVETEKIFSKLSAKTQRYITNNFDFLMMLESLFKEIQGLK